MSLLILTPKDRAKLIADGVIAVAEKPNKPRAYRYPQRTGPRCTHHSCPRAPAPGRKLCQKHLDLCAARNRRHHAKKKGGA